MNYRGDGGAPSAFWHSGGGTYIFVDGHVQFEKVVETITDAQVQSPGSPVRLWVHSIQGMPDYPGERHV
jgi:prepilin-type processing-associated H-X9-DG protein